MATPYIGQLLTVGFNFPPRNYALCQGQILSIAQNTALFSLLGTTYGGNGQTTFALPDTRGRVTLGQGQGPGLTNRVLGEMAGSENTTLLSTQMPIHEQSPQAGAYLARGVDTAPMPDSIPEIYLPAAAGDPATKVPLAPVNIAGTPGTAGGSQPFSTMQPYLVLNQCIALQGIFPSRN